MGVAIGIQSIFGTAEEVAYGTAVAPDRFFEFLPGETLERRANFVEPQGIGGSTLRNARRGAKRLPTTEDGGGSISFEVQNKGFGRLFKHLVGGTPVITTPVGATTARLHTYALGAVADRSLTLQKQFRDANGVAVKTLTYPGSILTAGEFSINPTDGLLRLALDVDAREEVDGVAAAAASWLDSAPFTYAQGTIEVAGVAVACARAATLRIENPMVLDRYCLGTAGRKARPIDSDRPAVTGSFTADFEDSTYYDLFVDNTAATLQLEFVGGLIEAGQNFSLTFDLPEIRTTGASPKVATAGIITQAMTFGGYANPAGDPAISLGYTTTDLAA